MQRDGPLVKRYKKDESVDPTNPNPSIVIHVRNLNQKATEADLLEALSHFGNIAYATCMPNKRMALVEFEELEGARSCVVYAQTNQIYVAGQPALFNYSTSSMIQRLGLESEKPNNVVIMTVYNAQYPINVEVIHQIVKTMGEVRRIAIIRRSLLQALVELDSVENAKKAKHALNGADIYSGCCTLKVEYAKPENVKVTRNDQDQWDFISPPEEGSGGRRTLLGDGGPPPSNQFNQGGGPPPNYNGPQQAVGGPPWGNNGPGGPPPHQNNGPPPHHHYSNHQNPHHHYNNSGPPRPFQNSNESQVVMVYGIDQERINCDKLFNLLCLYGNCEKIKFMKSKPDTCMAQMGEPQQVMCAIEHLHGAMLQGQKLALRPSKQTTLRDINDPFDMPDGTPSFKDYTGTRNQRFSNPESASRNRIVRPQQVLHWYNAPSNMDEQRLTQIFNDAGAKVPRSVTIFPVKSERSSAGVCEFESVEEATDGLIIVNHTPVDSPLGKAPYILKLAFAGGRDGREFKM